MRFRKLPLVVDAIRFEHASEDYPKRFREFFGAFPPGEKPSTSYEAGIVDGKAAVVALRINTPAGVLRANIGDWLIRGVGNELYPCEHDVFVLSYEPVD